MTTNLPNVSDEVLAAEVFEKVRADFAKFEPEELLQVNLDVPSAVSTILGVAPKVKALREQIQKDLPNFDLAAFDKLEDYALAFKFANTSYLMASRPQDDLIALSEEAAQLRDMLAADAQALSKRGLVDGGPLAKLKGANGYKNIAEDLEMLSQTMHNSWTKIQGKSATTMEDVETASKMSTRLMRIVGEREEAPTVLANATDLRLRAFTLLIRTYDDARRAVTYLRSREGDADVIAPSLYPGRPRKRGGTEPDAPGTDPSAPSGGPGTSAPAPAPVAHAVTEATLPSPAAIAAAAAGTKDTHSSKGPFVS